MLVHWCCSIRSENILADGVFHVQIHGWPDCSAGWRFQIPALLEMGFRVVAPDLMGFGGTVSSFLTLLLYDITLKSASPLRCYPTRVVGA